MPGGGGNADKSGVELEMVGTCEEDHKRGYVI